MQRIKSWWLLAAMFMVCVLPSLASTHETASRRFVLVIDAGHGGKDAGAVGAFSKEKNINLNVALAFGKLVENNCPDVKVIYTRKKDVFIPLQERANIANRNKANLFISIHTNALPAGRIAYGSETYTLGMARAKANLDVAKRENAVITYEDNYKQAYQGFDPNRAESYVIFEFMQDQYMRQSVNLARCIQQQYVNTGRQNKGVHQAGFLVLRQTSMPSVLTELGFITTPEEERFLNSDEGIEKLSRSIYNGFVVYRNKYDRASDLLKPLAQRPEAPEVGGKDDAKPEKQAEVVPVETKSGNDNDNEPKEQKADEQKNNKGADNRSKAQARTDKGNDAETNGKPVFKVQIFVSPSKVSANSQRLKGLQGADYYMDGGTYKYTYGSSTVYADIKKTKAEIADKFPDAFVVAFIDGKRANLQEAIRLSRIRKK